jgi:hypothetical protein
MTVDPTAFWGFSAVNLTAALRIVIRVDREQVDELTEVAAEFHFS